MYLLVIGKFKEYFFMEEHEEEVGAAAETNSVVISRLTDIKIDHVHNLLLSILSSRQCNLFLCFYFTRCL